MSHTRSVRTGDIRNETMRPRFFAFPQGSGFAFREAGRIDADDFTKLRLGKGVAGGFDAVEDREREGDFIGSLALSAHRMNRKRKKPPAPSTAQSQQSMSHARSGPGLPSSLSLGSLSFRQLWRMNSLKIMGVTCEELFGFSLAVKWGPHPIRSIGQNE